MDPFQGISAEIISNGQALELYDDPDAADTEEGYSRHHYVEAVAGSTFQVKVNLTPGFNFYRLGGRHAVFMQVKTDNLDNTTGESNSMRDLRKSFSRGETGGHSFAGRLQFCNETGQWMFCDYSFGNLVLNENSDPGFSVEQAQDLGRIQVIVRRVKVDKRKTPYIPDTTPIAMINEVPEKALKGRPIDTTVQLANARPSPVPSRESTCIRVGGKAGKSVVFNIYYRSRRALQMMGIIPRSPSPEVQDTKNDTIAPPEDAVQKEVQDLRARIALLERGLNVKPESSSAANRLKRERNDNGDHGNERSHQRRRTSAKVEHVDLNDDRARRRSPVKVEHVDLTDD